MVSFVIHSLYNEHTLDYDIALINIDGTIEISEQVGPVCLPFKHSQSHFQDETVEILGIINFTYFFKFYNHLLLNFFC